jgi:hypothetical protein
LAEPHTIEQIRKELARYGEYQVATFDTWRNKFD